MQGERNRRKWACNKGYKRYKRDRRDRRDKRDSRDRRDKRDKRDKRNKRDKTDKRDKRDRSDRRDKRDKRDNRDKRDKRDLVGPEGNFLDTCGVPRATFWTYLVSRVVPGRALRTVGKKVIQKYGNLPKLEAQRSPNGDPWAAFGQSVSHLGVTLGT